MNTQHTPGKWEAAIIDVPVADTGDYDTVISVGTADGKHLADCSSWAVSEDEAKANARLIAAAPDLLAACINALERFKEIESDYPVSIDSTLAELRSAIAKAMCPMPTPTPQ